jgi:hypothetical protein
MTDMREKQTVNESDLNSKSDDYFFAAKYFFLNGVELFLHRRQHCE